MGIPAFVWIIAYVLSALAGSAAWKERLNLSPVIWFLGAVLFGSLTVLMYLNWRARLVRPISRGWFSGWVGLPFQRVRQFGNTAILTGSFTSTSRNGDRSDELNETVVWVRMDNKWLISSAQWTEAAPN